MLNRELIAKIGFVEFPKDALKVEDLSFGRREFLLAPNRPNPSHEVVKIGLIHEFSVAGSISPSDSDAS